MNRKTTALTLVELLISLALLGIVLTAVVSVNIGTARSASLLQARNELLPETQIAQNYMANKLRQAFYVVPNNTVVVLGTTAADTLRNPRTGTGAWTIGVDPIVAFVLPPKNYVNGAAATNSLCPPYSAPAGTTDDNDNCFYFYAFYALKRGDMVNAVSGAGDPGNDTANDPTSWVLMEFRRRFENTSYSTSNLPTGGSGGRLLMDYLLPTTQTGADLLFNVLTTTPQAPGTTSITLRLASARSVAGQALRLPAATSVPDRYILTVYPRNVGKTLSN